MGSISSIGALSFSLFLVFLSFLCVCCLFVVSLLRSFLLVVVSRLISVDRSRSTARPSIVMVVTIRVCMVGSCGLGWCTLVMEQTVRFKMPLLSLSHTHACTCTRRKDKVEISNWHVCTCECVCVARTKDDTSKRKRLWMVGVVSEGLVKRWKS